MLERRKNPTEGIPTLISVYSWAREKSLGHVPVFDEDGLREGGADCSLCGTPHDGLCYYCDTPLCKEHAYLMALLDDQSISAICGGCRDRVIREWKAHGQHTQYDL